MRALLLIILLAGCGLSPRQEQQVMERYRVSCTGIWQDANSEENLRRTNVVNVREGLPPVESYDIPAQIQGCMARMANASGSMENARIANFAPWGATMVAVGDGLAEYNFRQYIRNFQSPRSFRR